MSFARQLPFVELQYVDITGSKAAFVIRAPIDTSYASIDASATALASIVASVTGCVLVRQRIIYKAVSTPISAAADGSSIKRAGMFFFESEDGLSQELWGVPGILDSVLVSSGPSAGVEIDTGDSDVSALVDMYLALEWVNPFGVEMHRLVAAYRQSRV